MTSVSALADTVSVSTFHFGDHKRRRPQTCCHINFSNPFASGMQVRRLTRAKRSRWWPYRWAMRIKAT